MSETTFHSVFLKPSDKPQQVLRLDDCRRWVSVTAEVGDLICEVATKKEKDVSGWAKLPADEVFNFWLEAGQELWMRVRTVDFWPGHDLVDPPGGFAETPEPMGRVSFVVCRDAA